MITLSGILPRTRAYLPVRSTRKKSSKIEVVEHTSEHEDEIVNTAEQERTWYNGGNRAGRNILKQRIRQE